MKLSARLASILFVFCFLSLAANASTYTVTNLNGGGAGSLPQAVSDANGTAADDTILFAPNLGCGNACIIFLQDELIVSPNGGGLQIDNQTAQTITLQATTYRHFYVNGILAVNNLTLAQGRGRTVFDPASDRRGGAVFVQNGQFTLINSIVRDSVAEGSAVSFGGAIYLNGGSVSIRDSEIAGNRSVRGGAIYQNDGTVSLDRTLIYDNHVRTVVLGNSSQNGFGGAIYLRDGSLYVVNTTIYGNAAENLSSVPSARGGAIVMGETGTNPTLQITNSSVVYNSSENNYGGIVSDGGNVLLRNTVVFGNTASNQILNYDFSFSGSFTSGGSNVFGKLNQNMTLQSNDRKDVTEAEVGVGRTLGYNGGTTRTLPLAASSILVNAGNNCVRSSCNYAEPSAIFTDQRGISRGVNGNVDIGAIERNIVQFVTASQLSNGRQGEFYSRQLQASGGVAPYSYSITNGSLTSGLTLDQNGQISGTPTASGTYNFTVQVTDSSPGSGFRAERAGLFDFPAPEAVTNTRAFQLQILAPTASSVSIGGRVLTATGRGISGATVTLTDASGSTHSARTNSFGYYRFDEVAAGATYVFQARHKRFEFAPQILTVVEEMNNLNFTAAQLKPRLVRLRAAHANRCAALVSSLRPLQNRIFVYAQN